MKIAEVRSAVAVIPLRSGERAAAMYSLIATAKLNDVDPRAWLADVLAASPITRRPGWTNSCPGSGATPASLKPPLDRAAPPRCPPEGYAVRYRPERCRDLMEPPY